MTITAGQAKDILLKSWKEFNDDQAPRLGAAPAAYFSNDSCSVLTVALRSSVRVRK